MLNSGPHPQVRPVNAKRCLCRCVFVQTTQRVIHIGSEDILAGCIIFKKVLTKVEFQGCVGEIRIIDRTLCSFWNVVMSSLKGNGLDCAFSRLRFPGQW